MRRSIVAALIALFALTAAGAAPSAPAHVSGSYLNGLSWRLVGPFRGGRALAVTGVPGEPDHYYFGSVDGGVWESTNAGRTWNPIFDNEHIGSIGAIAVAPSDTKTIYVGSGESDMRSDIAYGNGMYKSTDGGKTWSHIGLDDTRQIGSVVVDPHDANVVYVAALGHQYGPNAERGVFKTTDGGETWHKVLFKNDNTGAISLSIDPQNPAYRLRRAVADASSAVEHLSALERSGKRPVQIDRRRHDVDATHERLAAKRRTHRRRGRAEHALARLRTDRRVARSRRAASTAPMTAGRPGRTWPAATRDTRIWERGWYFSGITVDPKNPDVVYVMDTATYRSDDGGKTFDAIKGSPGGDDYHTLWIAPDDPTHMILGSDQGVASLRSIAQRRGAAGTTSRRRSSTTSITDNQFFYRSTARSKIPARSADRVNRITRHHLHGLASDRHRR